MKRKAAGIAGIILIIAVAVIAILMRTMSGSSTGIDNSPESEVHGDSRVLVAYFSWSGNGQQMARWIAEETRGEVFRIVPSESYGEDFNTCADRAKDELDNGIRPELSEHIDADTMAQYDVIFLGYPIWWGQAPKIISTFLESYNLSGKTIVPFCTSGSSGIGSSATNLHALTSGATWMDGQRFSGGASRSTVEDWVDGLELTSTPEA